MTYEEFKNELLVTVRRVYKDAGCVFIDDFYKGGDTIFLGDAYPEVISWRVKELYSVYKTSGWQAVLPGLGKVFTKGFVEKEASFCCESDYEKLKSLLGVRICSAYQQEYDYASYVHRIVDNIIIIPGIRDHESGIISRFIPSEKCGEYMRDPYGIVEDALANTSVMDPAKLYRIGDYRPKSCNYIKETGENTKRLTIYYENLHGDCRFPCFILSTIRGRQGACAVFYPGALRLLYRIIKEEFYVYFLNTDSVLVVPMSVCAPGEIRSVADNVKFFDENSMPLSDKLYRYLADLGGLREL
ncbi:MAG: DUF5688 family protein [Lachnospiraceae bacterium]|nr:DUF5688 family protein [Lachnospiraceae bacterium]